VARRAIGQPGTAQHAILPTYAWLCASYHRVTKRQSSRGEPSGNLQTACRSYAEQKQHEGRRWGLMAALSDQDLSWMYSQFLSLAIRKTGIEWQRLVTDMMHMRHGSAFFQVDPAGRGDKGCDGWVEGLMLACYGGETPEQARLTRKVLADYAAATKYWGSAMKHWAFVHNNANGLPEMVIKAFIELVAANPGKERVVSPWPPQVLWEHCIDGAKRESLVRILGAPPSDHPVGMSYLARCVECLARTRLQEGLDPILPVSYGKIEANNFGPEVTEFIRQFQIQTGHVRYYFSKASPGEQAQVVEALHAKYDGFVARLGSSDAVFHALCDDLINEAFKYTELSDMEQQRSAAITVVTHFFEICEIFKSVAKTTQP
jgi:hypothetical protein